MAGVGVGAWKDVPSACRETVKLIGSCQPDKEQADIYRQSYALYEELYPALKASIWKLH